MKKVLPVLLMTQISRHQARIDDTGEVWTMRQVYSYPGLVLLDNVTEGKF